VKEPIDAATTPGEAVTLPRDASRRRRLDWFEMILLGLVACCAAAIAYHWLRLDPEVLSEFQSRYGNPIASHGPEEWFIRDFFKDARNGVFVDVGAGPASYGSNTFFLETRLGWTGVAIDAQAEYESEYRTLRPNTRFVSAFIDDADGKPSELWILPRHPESSSRYKAWSNLYAGWFEKPVRHVYTSTTLNTLLHRYSITRVDYLNVDIELGEPQALAGFDIDTFRPSLASVEAFPPMRQAILDYFAAHRYVLVGKYLRDDPTNLWFRPLTARDVGSALPAR
jgi:hypothetical protein